MKAKFLIIVLYSLAVINLKAQIPNSSFENLTQQGKIKNWGAFLLINYPLSDSLIIDNNLYFSTNDAHTGSKALEMRNGYFYYSGNKIRGNAKMSPDDSIYAANGPLISLHPAPTHFNFYYKFFPTGNDTASASLTLFDSSGVQVGEATIEISGYKPNYTLATKMITYSAQSIAVFANIEFLTAKPGSSPNFGTRFLVDDVNVTGNNAVGIKEQVNFSSLNFFPNPVNNYLEIKPEGVLMGQEAELYIMDAVGKVSEHKKIVVNESKINISTLELKPGTYIIRMETLQHNYQGKFIK